MSLFDKARDRYPVPVIEEIDLKVTTREIPLTKSFKFVSRIIFHIEFATNTLEFTKFGIDTALTNGIQIKYLNELILPHGIHNNGEFSAIAYDTRIDTDATGTKINFLNSRFSFTRFTRDELGLKIDSRRQFFLVVQDDLSGSANTTIECYVEGWRF